MSRHQQIVARLRPAVLLIIMLGVGATIGDGFPEGGPGKADGGSARQPGAGGPEARVRGAIADCPKSGAHRTGGARSVPLRL